MLIISAPLSTAHVIPATKVSNVDLPTSTPPQINAASEIKALTAAGGTDWEIDMESLMERYVFGDHLLGDSTCVKDIVQLFPGCCLRLDLNAKAPKIEVRRYSGTGRSNNQTGGIRPKDACQQIFRTVERNVRHCVDGFDNLGVLLSGGFDSSVVAALAARHASRPLKTFTISDHADFADVIAARKVAAHLGTDHREIIIDPETCHENVAEGISANYSI